MKSNVAVRVNCDALCDDEHGIYLNTDTSAKYGGLQAYHKKEEVKKDSVLISFEFITDCCLSFSGSATSKNDTLFLKYYEANDKSEPCDCSCDYRMSYTFAAKDKNWSEIEIRKIR